MSSRIPGFTAALALTVVALLAAPAAQAVPPAHAPAHGWRAKHDPNYVGYTGYRWHDDYGIRSGRCDRAQVGTVLGAVIGGAVGSTVAKGDSRLIAILVGATVGAVIGREIGRDMDRNDHACLAHGLELASDGGRVRWDGARPGMVYVMTAGSGFQRDGLSCRRFTLEREWDGRRTRQAGSACRVGDGEWRMLDN